ncbi:hypothetical protein IWW36_003347 [Coemansia brasiliensis]|uniref:Integrator complex subunit 4 n=1 Tax=Coemansia brasiliensis TaxID=2650707 RepID=A0A9W8I5I8_9FUNG|nr:hypothetical protein IWW36_003347 [Coemansia brasiliensis]
MSAKRGYAEAESSIANKKPLPYATYEEAHQALQTLKRTSICDEVQEHEERALATVDAANSASTVMRQMGIRVSAQLCAHPETDAGRVGKALVQALKTSKASVCCEIYMALISIFEVKDQFIKALDADTLKQLSMAVHRDLANSQHHVRGAALAMLMHIADDALDIVRRFTTDAHAKVRQAALAAIQQAQMQGTRLPLEIYDDCVAATKDTTEQVRLLAADLVWAVASAHSEHIVDDTRLIDDAFIRVCDMVNDGAVRVRQRACIVLGRFRTVDAQYLAQTLSKQLMSHMKRVQRGPARGYAGRNSGVRSSHTSSTATTAAASSSGPAIPTPTGDANVGDLRILDSGAAGAFVHALEDEFQEVRDAAIESILELSSGSHEFAARAVDFLVDMFNDSSDRVRVRAIRALTALGARSPIRATTEQLSIAESAMRDSNSSVRCRMYEFLAHVSVPDTAALLSLIQAFKTNLEAYSGDLPGIFAAISSLGRRHGHLIGAPTVRSLLGISELYLSREPRIDDTLYAASVVLLVNAKKAHRSAIAAALPDFVFEHLPYLQDKYPGSLPSDIVELVPTRLSFVRRMLDRPEPDLAIDNLVRDDSVHQATAAFETMCIQIQKAFKNEPGSDSSSSSVLQQSASSVMAMEESEPQHKAVARYAELIALVLQAQDIIRSDGSLLYRELTSLAARIMYGSYSLEARTLGLHIGCCRALGYLRIFAHAIWLISHSALSHTTQVKAKMHEEFHTRISLYTGSKQQQQGQQLVELTDLSATDTADQPDELIKFIRNFKALEFMPQSRCQYATASVELATQARRSQQKFNHLFPLSLQINAQMCWAMRRDRVLVTVTLPTQKICAMRPPPAAFKPMRALHWSLEWHSVPLSLPLGSGEPASVALSMALLHPVDVSWSDLFIIDGLLVPASYDVSNYYKGVAKRSQFARITVSDPVSVTVNPIEFRPPASAHTRA